MSAIAKRYAKAGFAAVREKSGDQAAVDALAGGLQRFTRAYDESAELREVLRNPQFKASRADILAKILAKLGIEGVAARLIQILVNNERVESLPDVAAELETLADAQAGRFRARVTSAVEPTAEQQKRMAKALEARLGRPVALNVRIDPTLLGGLVCQVGDLTLDSSLKRQLEILTERLGAHA